MPREFVFVDELAANLTGKVVKQELKARLVGARPEGRGRSQRWIGDAGYDDHPAQPTSVAGPPSGGEVRRRAVREAQAEAVALMAT